MVYKEWEIEATKGLISIIKKSIERNGKLLDCWKSYLKNMHPESRKLLSIVDEPFMNRINHLLTTNG